MLIVRSSSLAIIASLALPLALASVACGGDDASEGSATKVVRVETLVQPGSFEAGGHAQVLCAAVNKKGEPIPSATSFTVVATPADGAAFDSALVMSSTRAGTVTVACQYAGVVDATPEVVTVTAGPGTHTVMSVSPASIRASESAATTCFVADQYGNDTGAAHAVAAEPADIAVRDGVVIGTIAGDYTLTCTATGMSGDQLGHATVSVTPGDTVELALAYEPDRPSYDLENAVKITGVGLDIQGNVTQTGIALTDLAVEPSGHANVVGQQRNLLSFLDEGRFTVTAKSASDPTMTASSPIVVDQTPPALTLTSPERGTVHDADNLITFAGTVSDNLGEVASLTVNGTDVPLPAAGGSFSAQVPLTYGVDIFHVVATDPYGLETVVTRAAEKSTEHFAMESPTVATDAVSSGGVIFLMPELFDDGDHTEAARDDLASLLLDIVKHLDLTALVPNPLTSFACIGGNCTIRFTGIGYSDVRVGITLKPGRLHVHVEMDDMSANIALDAPCSICNGGQAVLPGAATADRVVADLDVVLSLVNGQAEAAAENAVVTLEGFDVHIDDPTGILQSVVTLAVGLIKDPLVNALEGLLAGLMEDQLGPALGSIFNALYIDQDLEIPSPIGDGDPNTLKLLLEPEAIDIAPERAQVRMRGLAYAKVPKRPYPSLGSVGHEGCRAYTPLGFPAPTPLTVGVHDSFINQILYAVWEGGTISLDVPAGAANDLISSLPVQNLALKVEPHLPPVLNSCGGKESIQLGDLFLDATFDLGGPVHLGMWLQVEAGVNVVVEPNAEGRLEARIEVGDFDTLTTEIVTNEGLFAGDDGAVEDLVKNVLVPQLLSSVGDAARFALPQIDLHEQSAVFPPGTTVDFVVQQVSRDNAYLTVQGGLK